jgi:perosamine synthetase
MQIPWAKPSIMADDVNSVARALRESCLTMGSYVRRFEEGFARYVGVAHAIAVSNGTVALELALRALKIGKGDEVIVPALNYIAAANVVRHQGARPCFVDVAPDDLNLDPQEVRNRITPRTRAIILTDYAGSPCDYDALCQIAQEHGLHVIVDGAQSLGALYKGRTSFCFGDIATTSFHAAKVLTTGEGGMIFTPDPELAERLRILRNQGESPERKYVHPLLGTNARMTDFQAALGLAQLTRLQDLLTKRRWVAKQYTERMRLIPSLKIPLEKPDRHHAWFTYVIRIDQRDRVMEYLKQHGIETRILYPLPVYEQPIYRDMEHQECPVAKEASRTTLALPIFYDMQEEQIDLVCKRLTEAVA